MGAKGAERIKKRFSSQKKFFFSRNFRDVIFPSPQISGREKKKDSEYFEFRKEWEQFASECVGAIAPLKSLLSAQRNYQV